MKIITVLGARPQFVKAGIIVNKMIKKKQIIDENFCTFSNLS